MFTGMRLSSGVDDYHFEYEESGRAPKPQAHLSCSSPDLFGANLTAFSNLDLAVI